LSDEHGGRFQAIGKDANGIISVVFVVLGLEGMVIARFAIEFSKRNLVASHEFSAGDEPKQHAEWVGDEEAAHVQFAVLEYGFTHLFEMTVTTQIKVPLNDFSVDGIAAQAAGDGHEGCEIQNA
jgi:hypothetical protein